MKNTGKAICAHGCADVGVNSSLMARSGDDTPSLLAQERTPKQSAHLCRLPGTAPQCLLLSLPALRLYLMVRIHRSPLPMSECRLFCTHIFTGVSFSNLFLLLEKIICETLLIHALSFRKGEIQLTVLKVQRY